jgi:transposase-like protein
MNNKELEAFTKQAAKSIKTESDLTDFCKMLTKVTVEAALNAELDEHFSGQLILATHVMNKAVKIITVMAIPLKLFVPKMVKLI